MLVHKEAVAKLAVGLNPYEEVTTTDDAVPLAKPRSRGRPRNSIYPYANSAGLQRFAAMKITEILDEKDRPEREELERVCQKDLPSKPLIQI